MGIRVGETTQRHTNPVSVQTMPHTDQSKIGEPKFEIEIKIEIEIW